MSEGEIMTCSHDVIGLASGDVRISLEELTMNDRMRLFWLTAEPLTRLLREKKGMSGFIGWKREWEEKSLGQNALWRYSLSIPNALEPSEESYSVRTRIHPLACEYCRLPNYDKPKDGNWTKGEQTLTVRICIRDDGKLFLEKYTGKVISEMGSKRDLIKLVTSAEYIPLERGLWMSDNAYADGGKPAAEAFGRMPALLYGCLSGMKKLVHTDREFREMRLRELKEAEQVMHNRTRMFGVF